MVDQRSTNTHDGQFEVMRGDLAAMKVELNTVSREEHVPEVKQYNRTVKEHVQGNHNTTPFTRVPVMMVIENVSSSIMWLNNFPRKVGCQRR